MKDYESYYNIFSTNLVSEIARYDQLTIEEIIVHIIYTEFYYPKVEYVKYTKEDKYVINEAVGRYCKKNNINIDHIFGINIIGDLVPKRILEGYMNVDKIVNSHDGTLIEWEIRDNIKEVRSEMNKRNKENEYNFEWNGNINWE